MPASFDHLRLLADDLTGALDSAVAFVRAFGPLEVGLEAPESASLVLDSATRERSEAEAVGRVASLAPMLKTAAGRLAFLKVDSLLRGHAGAELAAILAANSYARVILAPALPAQGRITRQGRQMVNRQATGEDLAATLRAQGHDVSLRKPGECAEGISLFDAESDADLDRIVAAALPLPGGALWVGTGGLAAALGRAMGAGPAGVVPMPEKPLLGLVGTDHPAMQAQLARVGFLRLDAGKAESLPRLRRALGARGFAFATCDLPLGTPREIARERIAQVFAETLVALPRPGTLFASGGETLRALIAPLGARGLRVEAEFLPGMPLSRLVGGPWNGLALLSKSGAFGAPDMLETLVGRLELAGKAFGT
jgi:D-threonate/D-erythronate kinase